MNNQTLIQQWDAELANPINFALRFGNIARRLLEQGDKRISHLEATIDNMEAADKAAITEEQTP